LQNKLVIPSEAKHPFELRSTLYKGLPRDARNENLRYFKKFWQSAAGNGGFRFSSRPSFESAT